MSTCLWLLWMEELGSHMYVDHIRTGFVNIRDIANSFNITHVISHHFLVAIKDGLNIEVRIRDTVSSMDAYLTITVFITSKASGEHKEHS